MEISRDLLPASFDRLIPVWELALDSRYNVREERPTDELVESVRKTGFREAAIVRPGDDGKFLVTDGWQRVQAGIRAGWTEIPCKIFKGPLEAMDEAKRASIQRPWTTYQRIKHYRNYYDACREEGMTHYEAIQRTIRNNPASEITVRKYLRITRLDPVVQALLKKPEERTQQEWDQLQKIYYAIRLKRKTLTIGQADIICTYLQNFPVTQQVRAAIGVLGLDVKETLRKIRLVSIYPDADPLEVIQEIDKGYGPDEILDIGVVIVNPKLKCDLAEYCSNRRINYKDFIKELLTEWQIVNKGSCPDLEPALTYTAGIKEVSFKIGERRVTILQHQGKPTILVDGSPPIFFTPREVKEKAWNRNIKLPSYLKEFLNNLKIEM